MIRIAITEEALADHIKALVPDWLMRAEARNRTLQAEGAWRSEFHDDEDEVEWTEVKPVYRKLQGDKCAYCEKPLEEPQRGGDTLGGIEQDIEHYRPKAKTARWSKRKSYPAQWVSFTKRPGRLGGYHWLAFHPLNYCAACKTCNSTLKGNRFPILGDPGAPGQTPAELQEVERPLLFYPLADIDEDPEEHIDFLGFVAKPHARPDRHRAQACIAFFLLNARPSLQKGRAYVIVLAWKLLTQEQQGDAVATGKLDRLIRDDRQPYAGCLRAFVRLARADPTEAKRLTAEAEGLLVGS